MYGVGDSVSTVVHVYCGTLVNTAGVVFLACAVYAGEYQFHPCPTTSSIQRSCDGSNLSVS